MQLPALALLFPEAIVAPEEAILPPLSFVLGPIQIGEHIPAKYTWVKNTKLGSKIQNWDQKYKIGIKNTKLGSKIQNWDQKYKIGIKNWDKKY